MSKYGARKTTVDGITFDSAKEARRYIALRDMASKGLIHDLELQPSWELLPGVKLIGDTRKRPAVKYVADFAYRTELGAYVVEDVKGMDLQMGRMKRHMMKAIHNIDVRIV